MTHVTVGTLLAGKYRIESLIGRGGMGSVWRAEHLTLNAPVAVKVLNLADLAPGSEALSRFHREARAAAAIRSPHVVQIFDHGIDSTLGVPFIVMELMEGESLAERLTRCSRIGPAEVARIFTQIARALSRAHEAGIVHRDLKPDNVFLVRNEDEEIAKVLDFGIAKLDSHLLNSHSGTRTGAVMGTAYYMSPEQITGSKQVDLRSDLWAFGVMACECLTGVRPFEAETVFALTLRICIEPIARPSSLGFVPAGFDDWFARIVNRDQMLRFSSAREAADALRQACNGEVASQHLDAPQSPPDLVVPLERRLATGAPLSRTATDSWNRPPAAPRRAGPWLLAAGGLCLMAALVTLLWYRLTRSEPEAAVIPSASAAPRVVAAPNPAVSPPGVVPVVPETKTEAVTMAPSAADSRDGSRPPPPRQAPAAVPKTARSPVYAIAKPNTAAVSPKSTAPVRDLLDERR